MGKYFVRICTAGGITGMCHDDMHRVAKQIRKDDKNPYMLHTQSSSKLPNSNNMYTDTGKGKAGTTIRNWLQLPLLACDMQLNFESQANDNYRDKRSIVSYLVRLLLVESQ